MRHRYWVLFLWLAMFGCAHKSEYAPARTAPYGGSVYQKMSREAEESVATSDSYAPAEPAATGSAEREYRRDERPEPAPPPGDAGGNAQGPSGPQPPQPATPVEKRSSVARMIIYAARLAVEVVEPEKSVQAAMELMRRMGGFLAQRNDYALEIRIPSALFFDFVRELEQFGTVTDRVIASEDVTEQYADLALRLENLNAMKARLLALLEQARTVEERLAIERELSRVNEEIDVISGRMRLLKNLADYATVFVRFTPRYAGGPPQPQKEPTPVWWVRNFDISALFGGQR